MNQKNSPGASARCSHYREIALNYARTVADDSRKANEWIRLAATQTLRDFDRQDQKEFPFYFDDLAAFRACLFIEHMPHVKGKWAAKGDRLQLSDWQIWITASIFGWKNKKTENRRYRRALILVPRKNGKSAWAAAIGLYMLAADGEAGAEVFSGATSEKQALEVFRPAQEMARRTPRLLDRFGLEVNAKSIISVMTGSRFQPLIAKPGDGASPSCAIIDEYHEHETDLLIETMRTGMGARENPLLLMITTAGDNLSGPCYAAVNDAKAVLSGAQTDDALFSAIFGLDNEDDWTTDHALKKANPNYGISVSADFLKHERDDALKNARRQAVFKTKHLNEWVGARHAFFNMRNFSSCADPNLRIEAFERETVFIGLDLASKQDLTAVSLVFPRADGAFACFGRHYLPAAAMDGRNRDRYAELMRQGRLIICGEGMIDQDRIEEDLRADLARFDVRGLAFDPWNAGALIARLQAAGAPCIEFRKTTQNVSAPMKTLAGLIDDGRLQHEGDEAIGWMLGNVVTREDTSGNVRPVKAQPDSKIDAADALISAIALALADEASGVGREIFFMVG